MSILAWFSIILGLAGIVIIGVSAYLAFNNRNNPNSSDFAFYLGIGGAVTFFLAWILFAFFLFVSKGLDLNAEAVNQLRGILPNPDAIRNEVVNSTDERFASFVGV